MFACSGDISVHSKSSTGPCKIDIPVNTTDSWTFLAFDLRENCRIVVKLKEIHETYYPKQEKGLQWQTLTLVVVMVPLALIPRSYSEVVPSYFHNTISLPFANNNFQCLWNCTSLMYNMKTSGPETESWGTPHNRFQFWFCSICLVNWFQFSR